MDDLLVEVEESETTKMELLEMITAWLLSHDFKSSAQLLYEEASAQLRDGANKRKTVSALCRAIDERDWDKAHKKVNDLLNSNRDIGRPSRGTTVLPSHRDSYNATALSLLLTEQQFMELVDEDSGQRAFTFFMRNVKPYESVMSRQQFHKLTYLLTCKNLEEAAKLYPELRGWTPETGRSALKANIQRMSELNLLYPETRPRHLRVSSSTVGQKHLHLMLQEALSFRLLSSRYPRLLHDIPPIQLHSYIQPLAQQTPPTHPLLSIDVDQIIANLAHKAGEYAQGGVPQHTDVGKYLPCSLTCCEDFLDVHAVVAGTDTGDVLWIPVAASERATNHRLNETISNPLVIYCHHYAVRGMQRYQTRLLIWGGPKATILELVSLVESNKPHRELTVPLVVVEAQYAQKIFTHIADIYSSVIFPCGSIIATGLTQGAINLWDATNFTKLGETSYRPSSVLSLVVNAAGTTYFAGYKEGVVCIVDVVSGILLQTLFPPAPLELSSIALSPSSSLLLTSYKAGYLRLWNVLTCAPIPVYFTGSENNTRSSIPVSFGARDEFIFAGSEDGRVCFWSWHTNTNKTQDGAYTTSRKDGQSYSLHKYDTIIPSRNQVSHSDPMSFPNDATISKYKQPTMKIHAHTNCILAMKIDRKHMLTAGKDGLICIYASLNG